MLRSRSRLRVVLQSPIVAMLLASLVSSASRADTDAALCRRLSIAEPPSFRDQPEDQLQHRFDLYKSIGIGLLRQSWGWRGLELSPGHWQLPLSMPYLRLAARNGFQLKMTLDDINAPPQWYLISHPESQIRNRDGQFDASDMSLWDPKLHALLDDKMDHIVQLLVSSGVIDSVAFLVIGLGPAGEPRYPSPWRVGAPHTDANKTFWYYDANARADFVGRMQEKYGDIDHANRAWKTAFPGWADVVLPGVGAKSEMWRDVLTWYRDSKRDFVEWQINDVTAKLDKYASGRKLPQLMIFVPGGHLSPRDWDAAATTGDASAAVILGTDTDFLLETARRHHLWLQQTGAEAEHEIIHIKQYMKAHDFDIPMWGENAGGRPALDPEHLADVVIRQRLYGLEYVDAAALFDKAGRAPNAVYPALVSADARLRQLCAEH